MDDEQLLRRAEEALTEIKVQQGLSEQHAAVLAALRIRLKGATDKSLDEMLTAAGDLGSKKSLEDVVRESDKPKRSLDDLLQEQPKKPEWPGS